MTIENDQSTTVSITAGNTSGLSQNATNFMAALKEQGIDVTAALQELAGHNVAATDPSDPVASNDSLVRPRFPFDKKRPDHTLVARQIATGVLKKRMDLPGDSDGDPVISLLNKGRWTYPEYLMSALYYDRAGESSSSRTFHVNSTTVGNIKRDFPLPQDPLVFARKIDDDIVRILGNQPPKGIKCKDLMADMGQYQEWFNEQCSRFTVPCLDILFQVVYHLDPKFTREYFPEFFHGDEANIPQFRELGKEELLLSLAQATEGLRTLMREQRRAGMLIQQQQRKWLLGTLGDALGDEAWRKKASQFFVSDDPVYLFGNELMEEFHIKQERKLRQKALFAKQRPLSTNTGRENTIVSPSIPTATPKKPFSNQKQHNRQFNGTKNTNPANKEQKNSKDDGKN